MTNRVGKVNNLNGFDSILYSIDGKPLVNWEKKVRNGSIKRLTDKDLQSLILEIIGSNVSTTFITCPTDPKRMLCIKLSFLVLIIKNLKKYFTFEVQPFVCTLPMRLEEGWNQIQFNLQDFTRRAYGTNYVETLRIQIHANCRVRRIYFCDRPYSNDELLAEFEIYLPINGKK